MLANDLRPHQFADVRGQDTVVNTVCNFIKEKKYPNVSAYIGGSGLGKNTIANIVAMTLNCEHPKEVNGRIEPCCECSNCRDIIEERFQKDVHVYSGNQVTADVLRDDIEQIIQYASLGNNTIIVINEAQTCTNLRRLLEVVETPRPNVYWIFTSTDQKKFTSTFSKDNKQNEQNAFRSRCSVFTLKPADNNVLGQYLFDITDKIAEQEGLDIPEEFYDNVIPLIVYNVARNFRQGINDLRTVISGRVWDKEEARTLLGYVDEVAEYDAVVGLCTKSQETLNYIRDKDAEGFVVYARKIISDCLLRKISGTPFDVPYKENSFQKMDKSGNLIALGDMFNEMAKYPYFNEGIFYTALAKYYLGKVETPKPAVPTRVRIG